MPEVEDEGEGGDAWLGGEDEGVEAELMGSSEGRGGVCGGNYGDRRRGTCSAVTGEREGDEEESERVREGDVGVAWHFRASPGRRRKQEVADVSRGRRPRAPRPSGARRTTTGSASRLGRARWLGQHR